MKRLFAFVLALAMIFSLSVTAFAAEETQTPANGTITIKNATVGQTYSLYKIFDATHKETTDENGKQVMAIAYTITSDTNVNNCLFGEGSKGKNYFNLDESTGAVTKKADVDNSVVIEYLNGLFFEEHEGELVEVEPFPAKDTKTAITSEVKFTGLTPGYYLVRSSLGSVVTITSNTPDATIIDKNQDPANNFKKEIKKITVVNGEEQVSWVTENSANIGDTVSYKVSFTATNYDGDSQIHYYYVNDTMGSALKILPNTVRVKIGGDDYPNGYYLDQGVATPETLTFIGGGNPDEYTKETADWYFAHTGDQTFRVTIPWLEDHGLAGNDDNYSLTFTSSDPEYTSPVDVEVTYDAVLQANPEIGGAKVLMNSNKANAYWVCADQGDSSAESIVYTHVYGLGILKDDEKTKKNLAGAEFTVYKDADCSPAQAVNVIPTEVQGEYMVDSEVSRAAFSYNGAVSNRLVTPVNGKIMLLGLEAGTYYVKEEKAPDGYNKLNTATAMVLDHDKGTVFKVYANEAGEVVDIQDISADYPNHVEHKHTVTHTVIHNNKGVELPSTGGEGTMMLITMGTMVAMVFVVLLITHKKMSIYED